MDGLFRSLTDHFLSNDPLSLAGRDPQALARFLAEQTIDPAGALSLKTKISVLPSVTHPYKDWMEAYVGFNESTGKGEVQSVLRKIEWRIRMQSFNSSDDMDAMMTFFAFYGQKICNVVQDEGKLAELTDNKTLEKQFTEKGESLRRLSPFLKKYLAVLDHALEPLSNWKLFCAFYLRHSNSVYFNKIFTIYEDHEEFKNSDLCKQLYWGVSCENINRAAINKKLHALFDEIFNLSHYLESDTFDLAPSQDLRVLKKLIDFRSLHYWVSELNGKDLLAIDAHNLDSILRNKAKFEPFVLKLILSRRLLFRGDYNSPVLQFEKSYNQICHTKSPFASLIKFLWFIAPEKGSSYVLVKGARLMRIYKDILAIDFKSEEVKQARQYGGNPIRLALKHKLTDPQVATTPISDENCRALENLKNDLKENHDIDLGLSAFIAGTIDAYLKMHETFNVLEQLSVQTGMKLEFILLLAAEVSGLRGYREMYYERLRATECACLVPEECTLNEILTESHPLPNYKDQLALMREHASEKWVAFFVLKNVHLWRNSNPEKSVDQLKELKPLFEETLYDETLTYWNKLCFIEHLTEQLGESIPQP